MGARGLRSRPELYGQLPLRATGRGGTRHGHQEEEVFFVVEGQLAVAWANGDEVVEVGLGLKDMLFSPPGHLHSYRNKSVEGAYLLIMLGSGRPAPAIFA